MSSKFDVSLLNPSLLWMLEGGVDSDRVDELLRYGGESGEKSIFMMLSREGVYACVQ